MGKKKKGLSDRILMRKKPTEKKVNPFEVKVNRQKHKVIGRKISKHDRGMPGISRSKAITRRKETLLQEYKQRHKTNKFIDKRIGENNPELSVEEKMMQRFALEKQRHHEKSALFNLNEDEDDLTHYGQSLADIEKFDDPVVSDEDEDDAGRIDASIVGSELFGGFMTKREEDSEEGGRKSWKEKMHEMISKSRKERYERQSEKQKDDDMREKLDAEWKEMRLLMKSSQTPASRPDGPTHADDYDIAVRELMFEIKGNPSDRLKTVEEIAAEEKEQLEKLESDRQLRMQGIQTNSPSHRTHRSADDLDDGFGVAEDTRSTLAYHEGKAIHCMGTDHADDDAGEDAGDDSGTDDAGSGTRSDEDNNKDEDDKEDEEVDDCDSEEGDESADSFSDIQSNDEEDEDANEDIDKMKLMTETMKTTPSAGTAAKKPVSILKTKTLSEDELKIRKEIMEQARTEIPYTFEVPNNYDGFVSLLEGRPMDDQLTIITRMLKCHHVRLAEGNRQKLEKIFELLLRYFGDLTLQAPPQLLIMDHIVHHLYDLVQISPLHCGKAVLDVITTRHDEFQELVEKRNGKGLYPSLDLLVYFKLISTLFPTSDFHHAVVTPTMMFMMQILSQSLVTQTRDVAAGLFICSLCLEYVSISKRFTPEVINFLHGVLFLAAQKNSKTVEKVQPPFRPVGKNINLLRLDVPAPRDGDILQLKLAHLSQDVDKETLNADKFKLSCINCCIGLLWEFSALYKPLPSHREIFSPVLHMCDQLPLTTYTATIQHKVSILVQHIKSISLTERKHLVRRKKKPTVMKMFEPKVEDVFDGKKKRGGGKQLNEKQKLNHKHKREMKGAIRELRKDTQFLARQQLSENLERDSERKRKVNKIYEMLSQQESDYKKMKREKPS